MTTLEITEMENGNYKVVDPEDNTGTKARYFHSWEEARSYIKQRIVNTIKETEGDN